MRARLISSCQKFSIAGLFLCATSLAYPGPVWSAAATVDDSAAGAAYTPTADPMAPITVGPRERVGKVSAGEKAAAGVMGGLIGGALGGSGGKSQASAGPKTRRDPTRKQDYAVISQKGGKLETGARAKWVDGGLLVSTGIEDSPDKGTFQTVFLQSCDGRRLYPQRYEIYQLWAEQSLSVSWSRTSTTNDQVTGHETGGWSESWSTDFASRNTPEGEELPAEPAVWQRLGFDRAQGGAREVGAYFNVSPQELADLGEVSLFVHTTRPAQDPVTTTAFNWLLSVDAQGPVRVAMPDSQSAPGATTAWQNWAGRCAVVAPLLAAAGGTTAAVVATGSAEPRPRVQQGIPLPEGLAIVTATGTGRTTGHIADLQVRNESSEPVVLPLGPWYIPASGPYQSYVIPQGKGATIAAHSTQTISLQGYCANVHRPPVPVGEPMPSASDWMAPGGGDEPIVVPSRAGATAPGRALIPGTGAEIGRTVDAGLEPEIAARLLLAAIGEIERATTELQASGKLQTPFSANPAREREAVVQQTLWLYAAELSGEKYGKEDFTGRLEAQHEQRTGVPITAAPPEERERLQQGADDFWDAFELVGTEAKLLGAPGATTAQPTGSTDQPRLPLATVAEGCTPEEKVEHTPQSVDVKIADSYGSEEDRKKISAGIKKAVEEAAEAYMTDTPPATAYALWGHDHIGGIASGYAKTVFLEANDQEWVWTTEALSTTAKGTGTHTLSFTHGPECTSVVAGAALMWIKGTSEAFDPLERNIEAFRTLDKVKELTVEYLGEKLPPGLDDALEAGVEAITDPSSDTYAAAKGSATLIVGGNKDTQTAENRVVYKREGKEDKAIVGGGETIKKLSAADIKPGSLTSKLDAESTLEAGASGNGFAKAALESLYGTILIGVCECPEGTTYKVVTDNGQFIRGEGAEAAVERAIREMDEAAGRIGTAIEDGKLEPTGDQLKARAEEELKKWGESLGGDRFKSKEEKPAASKPQ